MKPRIAILADYPAWTVLPELPRRKGTFPVWLTALHQALAEQREFEIHWITASKNVDAATTIEANGQYFHLFPRARKTIGLFTGYLWDRAIIRKRLSQIRPSLIHAWGTEDVYALAGLDYPAQRLLSIQGLLNAYAERGPISPFERRQRLWERHALKRYKHMTAESPWSRERVLETAPGARVELVEYGVEQPFFRLERKPSATPVFLYGGLLSLLKGTDTLLQAFSSSALAHVELRLAGNGNAADLLEGELPPNIRPLGPLDRAAMTAQMEEAWCLVHPSRADTGPTIAKEARVAGLPVILTEDCGSKQHVDPGLSGFVIPPGDVDALIQAVLNIASSRDQALDMGEHGRAACRECLRPERTASRFLQLYRCLLSSPSPCY